jgi:serine/threonine-protein phosphatase 2A regulatory subunit A
MEKKNTPPFPSDLFPPTQGLTSPKTLAPDSTHLDPIVLFVDNLKSDDLNDRIRTVECIDLFSVCLGPLRTREELIPFIKEFLEDEEEVILALIKVLPKLSNLLGSYQHLDLLINSLEILFYVDNPTIRENVIASVQSFYKLDQKVVGSSLMISIDTLWAQEDESGKTTGVAFIELIVDDLDWKDLEKLYGSVFCGI